MLTQPNLADEKIIECLQTEYGLKIAALTFLPLGADIHTAVYRAVAADGTPYFCKLRSGVFDETSVELPKYLAVRGIPQIIAPRLTKTGQLRAELDEFKVILYPFIEGTNGYQTALSPRQWADFGTALNKIHTTSLPAALTQHIQTETYSPQWRDTVKTYLERIEVETFTDAIAKETATFLQSKRTEILDLVTRAENYAAALQAQPAEFVLCHFDIHAGNLLITPAGAFYIVDWDNPILALKERDLMFIGGAQGFAGYTDAEQETLFYRGYGQTSIHRIALAYYRYERILDDIAVECEQIFGTVENNTDRARELEFLKSNFLPGGTIEAAYKAGTAAQSSS